MAKISIGEVVVACSKKLLDSGLVESVVRGDSSNKTAYLVQWRNDPVDLKWNTSKFELSDRQEYKRIPGVRMSPGHLVGTRFTLTGRCNGHSFTWDAVVPVGKDAHAFMM